MKLAPLLALALVACATLKPDPKPEIPPPNPIIPATNDDARACERLAQLGCSEAMHGCLWSLSQARSDGVAIPSKCVAEAADVAEVRKCGDVSTLTFECK